MEFPEVTVTDTVKAISTLKKVKEKSHADEIPVKINKEKKNLEEPLKELFSHSIKDGVFPIRLKLAKIILIHKSGGKLIFKITDQFLFEQCSPKILKLK